MVLVSEKLNLLAAPELLPPQGAEGPDVACRGEIGANCTRSRTCAPSLRMIQWKPAVATPLARYLRPSETRKNIEFELPGPRVTHQNFKPRSKRTEMRRQQRKPWFEGHFSRGKSTEFKNFAPAARWKASRRHFALIFGQKRPRGPRGAGFFADQALQRRTNVERQRIAVLPHGFAAIIPGRHADTVVRTRRGSWSRVSMYRNVTCAVSISMKPLLATT